MTWLQQIGNALARSRELIAPGRLVLVVGPSGAGKDTLLALARGICASDRSIVFPRRIVTRPSTADEEHDSITEAAFDQSVADGAFAFWWSAHGHKYALPLSVETDVRQGRTVVCNVSRSIVADLRERYALVSTVLVTAPEDILAERLRARGRSSDGVLTDRLARPAISNNELLADHVIHNVGSPAAAAAQLLAVIRSGCVVVSL